VHPLDGSEGVALLHPWEGGGLPPSETTATATPFRAGSQTRQVIYRRRPIDLPLLVEGATATELRERIDEVVSWFDPTRGEGRFRRRREDGSTREVWCRRTQGLTGSNATNWGRSEQMVVTVEAIDDPYVYDLDDTTATATPGEAVVFFDEPFLPLKLSSSIVVASPTIDNDGQAPAYPVWTITGPGTDPVVRNLTTGESFTFAYTLIAGQQIIVDTRPPARRAAGIPNVRDASGDNLFGSMSGDSILFPLAVGLNRLQFEMNGTVEGSSIAYAYRRRWLSI
jgi:hypothetical protein